MLKIKEENLDHGRKTTKVSPFNSLQNNNVSVNNLSVR